MASSENRHSERPVRSMRNVGTKWERSHSENRPVRAAGSSLKCTPLRRGMRDVRFPARAVWGVLCAIAPLKKWERKKVLPHRNWVVVALTDWEALALRRLPVHRGWAQVRNGFPLLPHQPQVSASLRYLLTTTDCSLNAGLHGIPTVVQLLKKSPVTLACSGHTTVNGSAKTSRHAQ